MFVTKDTVIKGTVYQKIIKYKFRVIRRVTINILDGSKK